MLHFQLDPHSGVPVYRQLMDQVKHYLTSETLKPGDQLPSIRQFAKALSVNPTTIVKAFTELQHAGLIVMKHGKGVFIADSVPARPRAELEEALRRLTRQLAVEATQLGASPELVFRFLRDEMKKLSSRDDRPAPKFGRGKRAASVVTG